MIAIGDPVTDRSHIIQKVPANHGINMTISSTNQMNGEAQIGAAAIGQATIGKIRVGSE